MTEPRITVDDDPAEAVARIVAEQAARGGSIVLTGGRTPGRAYERAAALQPDWSDVSVWFGDERCVPPEDERSNYALARRTLLDRLEGEPDVHRIRGELQPADAAGEYDLALDGVELDLLLLGVGPDGHIASLFPGFPQLDVDDRIAVGVTDSPKPPPERISLTFDALNRSKSVWFLVSGDQKAPAVARALAEGTDRHDCPASGVSGSEETIWFLDRAAASDL
jgi:6-phosphogluconolactonase